MSLMIVRRFDRLRRMVFKLWVTDAWYKWRRIREFVPRGASVLEIGAGPGSIYFVLQRMGYDVRAVDIEDQTLSWGIEPLIFDGRTIPYQDQQFDIALLLTVLHHAHDPDRLLAEAQRVARRVIVIEDVYTNTLQKYLTFFTDSVLNLEFAGHPHNNRPDVEWRNTFKRLGLKLRHVADERFFMFFRQATYVLD